MCTHIFTRLIKHVRYIRPWCFFATRWTLLLVFHRPTLFFASEENRPHHHHRSSRRARPPARPFTHARASTTLDGTSHLTVYRRGSRRHPRVPPPRLAIDGVARLPAPSRFDAARGTLTHPTPSRDAGQRGDATRATRGDETRASDSADTRKDAVPYRVLVRRRRDSLARLSGPVARHASFRVSRTPSRVCRFFLSSRGTRSGKRERGSKPGGSTRAPPRPSAPSSGTLVSLFVRDPR